MQQKHFYKGDVKMLKVLFELCSTQHAACIYTNYNDMNKFHFGFVLAVNEKEIAI